MAAQRSTESPMLLGDSRVILIAGNNATATTLTHLFNVLAADPTLVQRVRAEIGPIRNGEGNDSNAKLVDASFLNRLISETLQFQLPVPCLKSEAEENLWRNIGNESAGRTAAETEYTELVRSLEIKYGYDWSMAPEALFK